MQPLNLLPLTATGGDVSTGGDFVALASESLMFEDGDGDGEERCLPVTLHDDLLVECDEAFGVRLTLITAKASLSIDGGSDTTSITLEDSDGRL